ncbi:MAG: PKD domain-containing protein [Saprospiraceae bacterium]|nr:PKD domain-containing protein [Saprospiraceae bacterium]
MIDLQTPISLRDVVEVDAGRMAFLGTIPDNPVTLGATDIVVVTPAASVGIVYQNCALAATLSVPAQYFQWRYEGADIPGANQGVYFPAQPGLYEVQIVDEKGCVGMSDTFRVEGPQADFTVSQNGLEVVFTNTSEDANSYSWYFGDGTASVTQANPTHTFAASGVYVVTLIAGNICGFRDTVSYPVGVTSSFESDDIQHFSLSPNPNSGAFTVEMSGLPRQQVSFQVWNAMGQPVWQEEAVFQQGFLQQRIDIQHAPAGVYTLQIRSGQTIKNVRVLKQ